MSITETLEPQTTKPIQKKKGSTFELLPLDDLPDPMAALRRIAKHIRKSDWEEVRGVAGNLSYIELAHMLSLLSGFKFVAMNTITQTYYGVGGFLQLRPGVIEGWILGTDRFNQAYIPLTRAIRRDIIPGIKAGGAHRLECKSISTHTEAHRWLEMMGAKCEGTHEGYGINGEDFKTFAWRF